MVVFCAEWLAFEIGSFVSGSVDGVQLAAFTITLNLIALFFVVSSWLYYIRSYVCDQVCERWPYLHIQFYGHEDILYSAIFWQRKILANLANSTRIAKIFPAKTARHPPNFSLSNILIVAIHQSFAPPKNCAIRYT